MAGPARRWLTTLLVFAGTGLAPILAACGGGGSAPGLAGNVALTSTENEIAGGRVYATTTISTGRDTTIVVSFSTPESLRDRVVAHEFLHAAGLLDHEASPDCFLYKAASSSAPEVPCLAEIKRLDTVEQDFRIVVHDERLLEHALYARQLWAHYSNRDRFRVELGPNPAR